MKHEQKTHWVYILECEGHRFYTGYTTNLERRLQEHRARSIKSRFTRSFAMKGLACAWKIYATRGQVLRVEHLIKALSKHEKLQLIANPRNLHTMTEELSGDGEPLVIEVVTSRE